MEKIVGNVEHLTNRLGDSSEYVPGVVLPEKYPHDHSLNSKMAPFAYQTQTVADTYHMDMN